MALKSAYLVFFPISVLRAINRIIKVAKFFLTQWKSWWSIHVLKQTIFFSLFLSRGGKYAVQESEERQGRRDPYDDGGFPEYTQP